MKIWIKTVVTETDWCPEAGSSGWLIKAERSLSLMFVGHVERSGTSVIRLVYEMIDDL